MGTDPLVALTATCLQSGTLIDLSTKGSVPMGSKAARGSVPVGAKAARVSVPVVGLSPWLV